MFYRTEEHHGLPHNPFNAIVLPRPIGWISSVDGDGNVNLAPYSFFNAVAYVPPQVVFSATGTHSEGGLKDSVKNIEETGAFVLNLATWNLREQMNASSVPAPRAVNEFEVAGLTPQPSHLVRPPRVAESPVHLECEYIQTIELLAPSAEQPNRLVLGKVVGIHIDESVLTDGLVDVAKLQPIGRMGYRQYVHVTEAFEMNRPSWTGGAS